MSRPASLSLHLEVSRKKSQEKTPLVLDLWKGFSLPLKIRITNDHPHTSDDDDRWQFNISMFGPNDRSETLRDSIQVNLAQALNMKLLVIQDVHGEPVSVDDSANSDFWLPLRCWGGLRDKQKSYPLSVPSPGLLQQLRQKMRAGAFSTLSFCSETYPAQIQDSDALRWHGRDSDAFEWKEPLSTPLTCAPTTLEFRVVPGTPIPRFTTSFSLSSPTYKMFNDQALVIRQTTLSLATHPVRLAMVDSTKLEERWNHSFVEWSYNRFFEISGFRSRDEEDETTWHSEMKSKRKTTSESHKDPKKESDPESDITPDGDEDLESDADGESDVDLGSDGGLASDLFAWSDEDSDSDVFPWSKEDSDSDVFPWGEEDSDSDLDPDSGRIWQDYHQTRTDPVTYIIPGEYRRALSLPEHNQYRQAIKFATSTDPQRSKISGSGLPLQLRHTILCPGDQLVQEYTLDQDLLDNVIGNRRYNIDCKFQKCRYWARVSDADVAEDPPTSHMSWPDHGPIYLEPVS